MRTNLDRLTPRECDVLGCLFEGLKTGQIAERLCISPATVKVHLEGIYDAFGVNDRSGIRGLVAILLKRGWLTWNLPQRRAP